MHPIIERNRQQFQAVVASAGKELSAVRTGRANPVLVEQVMVSAYGARTPLKQLASISAPDASSLAVEPWDKSIVKDVERAIAEAKTGMTAAVTGSMIRLRVPPLTAESRAELSRVVGQKIEQHRVRLRSLRDRVRDEIISAEKKKEITQDDRYEAFEQLDELTKDVTAQLKTLQDKKTSEIQAV